MNKEFCLGSPSSETICPCRFWVMSQPAEEHDDAAFFWSGHQWVHPEASATPYDPAGEAWTVALQKYHRLIGCPAGSSWDQHPEQSDWTDASWWVTRPLLVCASYTMLPFLTSCVQKCLFSLTFYPCVQVVVSWQTVVCSTWSACPLWIFWTCVVVRASAEEPVMLSSLIYPMWPSTAWWKRSWYSE